MRTFASTDELKAAVGEHLGHSDWHTVTQEQINAFAEATGDHQWIHVDVARAAEGPFGQTIAHGFLSLSLTPLLAHQVYTVEGIRMGINYGTNKVRFPEPLLSGSRVRAGVRLDRVDDVTGGVQVVTTVDITVEGHAKPCCAAELVTRFLN